MKIQQVDLNFSAFDIRSQIPVSELRRNALGVQLLSPSLHAQLFPGPSLPKPPRPLLEISIDHLRDNDLSPEGAAVLPEISFNMPRLRGENIREHFLNIGQHTAEPYLSMAKEFMEADLLEMPGSWVVDRAGWTRYGRDGKVEAVKDLGEETVVSFDVEVLYKLSPYPVMATAVTPNAWYSWLSPIIFESPPKEIPEPLPRWKRRTPDHHPHHLIPLFKGSTPRVVIGHNVGYDRARVLEEYELERPSTRWLDTLSLHVATRGITSVQRPAWITHRKHKREKLLRETAVLSHVQELAEASGDLDLVQSVVEHSASNEATLESAAKTWEDVTSVNSLAEVAALHCGQVVDKTIRSRFGDDEITHASMIRPELHDLIKYCAKDVRITHNVYKKVLPLFLDNCPHPASFAGVLSMGSSFLPVNESWERYLEDAETKYREMDGGVRQALRITAEQLRKSGPTEDDSWHSQLDWSPKAARWSDQLAVSAPLASDDSTFPASTQGVSSDLVGDTQHTNTPSSDIPSWFTTLSRDPNTLATSASQRHLLPLLLRMSYKGYPVAHLSDDRWCFKVPHEAIDALVEAHGAPVELSSKDTNFETCLDTSAFFRISLDGTPRKTKLVGPGIKKLVSWGDLTSPYPELLANVMQSDLGGLETQLLACAEDLKALGAQNDWGTQLDWSTPGFGNSCLSIPRKHFANAAPDISAEDAVQTKPKTKAKKSSKAAHGTWPKWYWELTAPPSREGASFGELDISMKKTIAPLLLRLQWQARPLFHSREHKWLYRIPKQLHWDSTSTKARGNPLTFTHEADETLRLDDEHFYFHLPHPEGEGKNVGNPMAKSFVKAIESGELSSAAAANGDEASAQAAVDATNLNVLCSYWMSARERIIEQMVVYRDPSFGMILPQVITMGTVTRRAVEATWLTASNAKKNRIGSELKAMIRAPPGYAMVGADVDSEELWISSVMGDSQFGMHGATAIGWMTLEGTKAAGTDLHSKTAKILGTSRDAAKVFNYSRIYGAGQKHAVQLLMQGDTTLFKEKATELAKNLYQATKGNKTTRDRNRPPAAIPSIWHGGSESYLFNTLEAIALSDRPMTPALGCGVTKALSKSYLDEGTAFLPSRINWVVQSSGVDYLHLLIVSMEYLLRKYEIKARYLISVHDEVRYLAKDEDRYRTALALQIANAWTRALFCYNLGIDDVPQGVAFFSAVDVDHVLRKEVFMTCETPSHPNPIPAGESLDIHSVLKKTGGVLGEPIPDDMALVPDNGAPVTLFPDIRSPAHHRFLEAQAQSRGLKAKMWLDSLPDVVDHSGEPLPAKTSARKARSTQKVVPKKIARRYDDVPAWDDEVWKAATPIRTDTALYSRPRRVAASASKVAS